MTSRLGMELVSDWPHWAALVYRVYIFGRASSSLLSLALYYYISTTDHQALFAFVLVIVTSIMNYSSILYYTTNIRSIILASYSTLAVSKYNINIIYFVSLSTITRIESYSYPISRSLDFRSFIIKSIRLISLLV